MSKYYINLIVLIVTVFTFSLNSSAQSTDPDKPTPLTNGVIEGTNSGSLNDKKTYYYSFDVTKGNINLVVDITPLNKSDAGGILDWTLMNTKFEKLKWDIINAHATPERIIKDYPVTVKRKIILKVVAGGNMNFKLKFSGSATSYK